MTPEPSQPVPAPCATRRPKKAKTAVRQHEKHPSRPLAAALQHVSDPSQVATALLPQTSWGRAIFQAYPITPSAKAVQLSVPPRQLPVTFLGQEGKIFNPVVALSCHTGSVHQAFANLRHHLSQDLGLYQAMIYLSLAEANMQLPQQKTGSQSGFLALSMWQKYHSDVYQACLNSLYNNIERFLNTNCLSILPSLDNLTLFWQKAAASWQGALKKYGSYRPTQPPQQALHTLDGMQLSPALGCSPSCGDTASPATEDSSGHMLPSAQPHWAQSMDQYERALEHYAAAQIATHQTLHALRLEITNTTLHVSRWLSTLAPGISPSVHQQTLNAFAVWLEVWLVQMTKKIQAILDAPEASIVACHTACPPYQLSLAPAKLAP